MASITVVETAVPSLRYTADDVAMIGNEWLADIPEKRDLFLRFLRSSNTASRHFVLSSDELLAIGGMQKRQELFERFGPELGAAAVGAALARAGIRNGDLNTLLFTSCSCPSIPAIDALIIEQLELSRTIARCPVYQHGCAGGVVGLRLAADLAAVRGPVALASVETCSLVFQPSNPTPAQLVGAAIFADGAACALVMPGEEKGLVVVGHQSFLVPNSRHLMGYDIFDDGFHLRLDRELPNALASEAPEQVRRFLAQYGMTHADINFWLFHPGGAKILDFLEETFSLRSEQARWSRDVLREVGNLSSATILFVLKAFFDSNVATRGDKVLMLGVGPGLTIELILFEWVG